MLVSFKTNLLVTSGVPVSPCVCPEVKPLLFLGSIIYDHYIIWQKQMRHKTSRIRQFLQTCPRKTPGRILSHLFPLARSRRAAPRAGWRRRSSSLRTGVCAEESCEAAFFQFPRWGWWVGFEFLDIIASQRLSLLTSALLPTLAESSPAPRALIQRQHFCFLTAFSEKRNKASSLHENKASKVFFRAQSKPMTFLILCDCLRKVVNYI